MLKWIESTGKTEEAAIEAALRQLGMDRDEVSVEILERAKSGFLGIGSCPAKVKVTYEAPDEPAPVVEPVKPVTVKEEPVQSAPPKETVKPASVKEAVKPAAPAVEERPGAIPAGEDGKADQIAAFLTGLWTKKSYRIFPKKPEILLHATTWSLPARRKLWPSTAL